MKQSTPVVLIATLLFFTVSSAASESRDSEAFDYREHPFAVTSPGHYLQLAQLEEEEEEVVEDLLSEEGAAAVEPPPVENAEDGEAAPEAEGESKRNEEQEVDEDTVEASPERATETEEAPEEAVGVDEFDLLIEEGEDEIVEEEPAAEAVVESVEDTADSISEMPEPEVVEAQADTGASGVIVEEEEAELVVPAGDVPQQETIDSTEPPVVEAARIEDTRAINFAQNLEDYRSPKLAMLLSLLVPGAGQAYAKSYWKTALFGVVEAAVIGVSVAYYRKGANFNRRARAHADTAYSDSLFRAYYRNLWKGVHDYAQRWVDADPDEYADSVLNTEIFAFYGEDGEPLDTTYLRRQFRKKSDEFYALIEDDLLIQGWKDVWENPNDHNPVLDPELVAQKVEDTVYASGDTVIVTTQSFDDIPYKYTRSIDEESDKMNDVNRYGFSDYYDIYRGLIRKKNSNYRTAGHVLYVMLVNHIASAIDAGISAKAHNARLLNKQSFWRRIHIEQQWVNTGDDLVPGIALGVSF